MHEISKEILHNHQVRKTKQQKERFRKFLLDALAKKGIDATVEKAPRNNAQNIIVGDLGSARYIFTAHYDTEPKQPFPAVIGSFSLRTILPQLLMLAVLMLLAYLVSYALSFALVQLWPKAQEVPFIGQGIQLIALIILLCFRTNKHIVNDNTSGICVLVDALMTLPESARKQAAFVFFDYKELGLLGSAFFAKEHGKQIEDTPLINFDCVGDGEVLAFMAHKALFADEARMDEIRAALPKAEGKETRLLSASKTQVSSDHKLFSKAMGVAALKKGRWLGLYIRRRNAVCEESNLRAMHGFVAGLLGDAAEKA